MMVAFREDRVYKETVPLEICSINHSVWFPLFCVTSVLLLAHLNRLMSCHIASQAQSKTLCSGCQC